MQTTLETLEERLAVLDALIARVHAQIVTPDACDGGCSFWDCARPMGHAGPCQPDAYKLDARPLAFALPVAHADRWGDLADAIVFGSSLAPGDARWSGPGARRTLISGSVDPSVAFAVAVGLGGDL
jgi:hypothetical protein